jgi:hypothetical protein
MLINSYFENRDNYPIDLIIQINDKLNSILVQQVDILHTENINIKSWQNPFEALSFKLSNHVASLQKLLSKSSIPYHNQRLELIDIGSINVITRAIIENYLTLYHFHFDEVQEEQKVFRYFIYVISALKSRQRNFVHNTENQQQLSKEKDTIDQFTQHLKTNPYFLGLSLKKQNHYLNTNQAKQLNWSELLDSSDLEPKLFKDTWRLLSNFAHSEFLSVLQIRDYPINPKQLNESAYLMGEISAMIIGRTIANTVIIFPTSKGIIDILDQDSTGLIEYFAKVGERSSG